MINFILTPIAIAVLSLNLACSLNRKEDSYIILFSKEWWKQLLYIIIATIILITI
jgi:hypothetical protein